MLTCDTYLMPSALYDAVGARVTQLSATPERILEALRDMRASGRQIAAE